MEVALDVDNINESLRIVEIPIEQFESQILKRSNVLAHLNNFGEVIPSFNKFAFASYDFNLYRFKNKLENIIFSPVSKMTNSIELAYQLDRINDLFDESSNLIDRYLEMFVEESRDYNLFISPKNFYFNSDLSKLASRDFRVLIDNIGISADKASMLYCGSIASLMMSGRLDIVIGADMIKGCLSRYGKVDINYQGDGYLSITVTKPKIGGNKVSSDVKIIDIKGT